MANISTRQAYKQCLKIARSHYENFPVASWLLPFKLRKPVAAIYAFARRADDIADEGDASAEQRLQQLDDMRQAIKLSADGMPPDDPVYVALADAMSRFDLPQQLFYDLLDAFSQDVEKKRYADFGEVMNYCRLSANPIGRLILHLAGKTERQYLGFSDATCSALQLINFYQDLSQDYTEMGRIYLPQDEMAAAYVSEDHFRLKRTDGPMLMLMRKQFKRANQLINAGAPLGKQLGGRLGFELRLISAGGSRIIQKLYRENEDLFSRPRLNFMDWAWMFWKALRAK